MMKSVQVDKGAIKFVLSGANIMCRGLTSPGGRLPDGLEAGEPVVCISGIFHLQAIFAEGKVNPLAVGELAMSSEEMQVLEGSSKLDVRRMRELELISAII